MEYLQKLETIPQEKRVYVDESGIDKYLVREYARAARGVKVQDVKRGKRFQRTNVVAAQYKDENGVVNYVAPLCYKHTTNGEFFENWFKTKLVKSISKGSTIIMDNASFHRKKKLRNLAKRHGMKLLFLPPYSPDYNPMENSWANMKSSLVDLLPDMQNLDSAIYSYFVLPFS